MIYFNVLACYLVSMNYVAPNESVLGTRSSLRVLRVLNGVSLPLSVRQIAQQTQLTFPAVSSVLDRLEAAGIVVVARAGNARTYQLERENLYVQQVVEPIFCLEDNYLTYMLEDIRETFGQMALSIILFGSFARRENDASSDVDILLVAKDKLQVRLIEEALSEHTSRFYRRFGHSLEALVYDVKDATQLHEKATGLFAEIRADGYLVSGTADWMHSE